MQETAGATSGFSVKEQLKVTSEMPQNTLEEQIEHIKRKDVDGLILDLRLGDFDNGNGIKAQFRGTTLAQEIRTRQKEGDIKQFPIFLFSGNNNIEKSLSPSTKGVFDICIEKEDIKSENYEVYQKYFISIAKAYKNNIYQLNINTILKLQPEENICVDSFIADFDFNLNNSTNSSVVSFIINEIMDKDSVLISEELLACRLGVDYLRSPEAWIKIKSELSSCKYTGELGNGWERWWMHRVKKWWNDKMKNVDDLQYISANERVDAIKEFMQIGDDLYIPENISKCNNQNFWTLCVGCNKPLDVLDGIVVVNQENLYPWQNIRYVSVECALKSSNISQWIDVASYEKLRFKELKEIYKRER